MNSVRIIIALFMLVLGMQGCSFRSTQLDLLMQAMDSGSEEIPVEDLAWTLIWSGETYTVIPVFSTDGNIINFTTQNGETIVAYDSPGLQVVASLGLIPERDEIVRITKTEQGLEYTRDDELLGADACEEFVTRMEGANTIWTEECIGANGEGYTNEIRVNGDGAIVLLRFLLHPDYPMASLTPNKLNF